MDKSDELPKGELTVRIPAMPGDANANGDIFGGWVVAHMDMAAGIRAAERARGRVATVAINTLTFKKPVKIGDTLCVYTSIEKVGRTSITLAIEAWTQRRTSRRESKVTEGIFVMVAIDEDGRPFELPAETLG
ncbi:(3S)-malyl-CoA thioesterase [Fulvimarina manganoxydans]|uniref:(3S)-malyl-CoA thioesterase n=1 Tax=Fulvimarina manganoxydans TaxID=937218 RepID=A0A1W2EDN6_9HYPH|nr:acyl-CoA thioesterase [Fulvimarina manganoxydans]MCK5933709.1 acyl-CoA thioesterase [Fulvimarina manganoxydans]MEE2951132.1 acyl-CoA thioesterase [Pseudomonadota bacterium]SMD07829.1 (3S)-malyl-CoA thioesterase [Fulvimarina manganoxydans]